MIKNEREIKYHTPVLVDKVCHYLLQENTKQIVDVTLGDGGHSLAFLQKGESDLQILGIDQDSEALERASARMKAFKNRFEVCKGNFAELKKLLSRQGITQVDGILADIGVSLLQISKPERGFSYQLDGPLRMVMDENNRESAWDVINRYSFDQLYSIIKEYGEERFAGRIARKICLARGRNNIDSTTQLANIVSSAVPGKQSIKSRARVFQAIRIYINKELESLQKFLDQAIDVLSPGGRLAVISYHSLEDRIVKNLFRSKASPCECPPSFPKCVCGKVPEVNILTKKVVRPEIDEIDRNVNARSAKLRVVEKLG